MRWPAVRWLAAALLLASVGMADTVVLKTGERFEGTVVREGTLELVLDSTDHGRLTIPMASVATVTRDERQDGPLHPEDSDRQDLESLFETSIPTPLTRPPPVPDLLPLSPRPTLPKGTNFVARTYWDGRLRYEFSTRIVLNDPMVADATWVDSRFGLRGRIGARLAVDAADFAITSGDLDVPGGVQLRTFQVLTQGEFGVWLTNQFDLQLGLIGGEFFLNKAYWRFVDLPHFGDLTIGYLTGPQTLGNLEGFGNRTFMEPSAGTAAFSPGNRLGIEWHDAYLGERMTATAGLFSIGQNPDLDFGNASQALAQPIVRLTGLPLAGRNHWLHLGASAAFVFSSDADIQFQARPESRIAPFLVNTGTIDSRTSVIGGLEAVHAMGPILLQAEYVHAGVFRDGQSTHFDGGYLSAGWMLTGEARPYNRFTGLPTRVEPAHPLWGPDSGWGAWEVAGRLSLLGLNDGAVEGGRMRIIMGGLNWYWNRYIRWQLNAGYSAVSGGPTPGDLLIVEGRFEAQF
ncbi:MAG: hypothetical protein KF791_06510 [Verrucomicrobiae bacterium]|nr:hypothetical protein [Verrucomicrobiae bacterium]